MHNGEALYASNAGKLDGLAPEAYIQPQDNILDNGHLEVNQQAKKLYDKPGLTVDRWEIIGEYTKVEVVDDGIKITTTQPTMLNIFIQRIEIEKDLIREELAATVALGDSSNVVEARVHAYSSNNAYLSGTNKFVNNNSTETFGFIVPENTKRLQFIFRPAVFDGQETFFVIKRAKLEKGRRFTGWPVWNYALELAKCQRYQYYKSGLWKFLGIGICPGFINGKYELTMFVALPVTMRTNPVATFENLYVTGGVSSYKTHKVTGIRAVQDYIGGVELALQTDDTLEIGVPYYLAIKDTNGYFYLNANL